MTEYAAGKYTITGPAVWGGDGTPSHKFSTGDLVQLSNVIAPDIDGDLHVYPTSGGRSGYIAATSLTPLPEFKVGDKVTVAADARTVTDTEVYFGEECEAKVVTVDDGEGNVRVRRTSAGPLMGAGQVVAPKYLTLLAEEAPEAPAEEAPTEAEADTVNVLALTEALGFLGVEEDTVRDAITLAKLIEKGV